MGESVEEYRKRRSGRLAARGIVEAERDSRFPIGLLREHGIQPLVNWTYRDAWEALEKVGVTPSGIYSELRKRDAVRLDADEGDEEGETGGGHPGNGHGNTKLPFGLCQREGIEIDPNWTPKDAWSALEGKGYSASEAYQELKDKGTVSRPKEPERKKTAEQKKAAEPKKADMSEVNRILSEREQKQKDLDALRAEQSKAKQDTLNAGIEFRRFAADCGRWQEMIDRHTAQYDLDELYIDNPSLYRTQREKRDKLYSVLKDSTDRANEARQRQEDCKQKEAELAEKVKQAEGNGPTAAEYRQAVQTMLDSAPYSVEVKEYRGHEQEARVLKGWRANVDSSLENLNRRQASTEENLQKKRAALEKATSESNDYLKKWIADDVKRLEQYSADFKAQRAELEAQKAECEAKLAECEKAMGSPKSGLPGADGKEWEKTYSLFEKYGAEPEGDYTELSEVVSNTRSSKVDYNGVSKYVSVPSEDAIIHFVGGGDMTKGSCASLGFAYLANLAGYEVLDFRGGVSQETVSRNCCELIRKLGAQEEKHTNDLLSAKALLDTVQEGRQYYLTTGRHAAVVRKKDGRLQYLELQSADKNGWHDFTDETLKHRFGCQKSHTVSGMKYESSSLLIDSERLMSNPEFLSFCGYINTAQGKQKKGGAGSVK